MSGDRDMYDHDEARTEPELMYVICAKCKMWLDVKPGRMNTISHGLCPKCYEEASRELDAMEAQADESVTRG